MTQGHVLPGQQRMEGVWRERADRLSRRAENGEAGKNDLAVIVLGLGQERYGIDLLDVAEVLPMIRVTPVPGAAPIVAGVINVHGEIRPVLNLRRLLAMEAIPAGHPSRVILLRREGREIGLQTDSVEQIRWIGSGDLGDAGSSAHIKGSTKDLLMLLSTEALFAELDTGVTT
jgi:chemotaxis signal transduction protein